MDDVYACGLSSSSSQGLVLFIDDCFVWTSIIVTMFANWCTSRQSASLSHRRIVGCVTTAALMQYRGILLDYYKLAFVTTLRGLLTEDGSLHSNGYFYFFLLPAVVVC